MAINPMQRKARNSFLLGFLLALIIGGLVAFLFYNQMTKAKDELTALEATLTPNAYVALEDMKSGQEFDIDDLGTETIKTSLNSSELITSEDFEYKDNEDGEIYTKKMILKIDVPAGTVITRDMLDEADDSISSDQRLQEYNMIILPTLLEEGDYIDVRLQLPTSEDYIVLTKKKVIKATADTIWLNMREDEILTLGNAIVEAYTITGSKLYATHYTQPGIQDSASRTYSVSEKIINLMKNDDNLIDKAIKELNERYNADNRNSVNDVLNEYSENMNDLVETGIQEEITKLQTSRQQYVESLNAGTPVDTTATE